MDWLGTFKAPHETASRAVKHASLAAAQSINSLSRTMMLESVIEGVH